MSKATIADPLAKVTVSIPISDALYLARAGVAAASKDDVTPVITGVLVSAENDRVKVVSTDRYRVHRASLTVENVGSFPPFLMPSKALRWMIANASFFGRGFLPPTVTFDFEPSEEVVPAASGIAVAVPPGSVTITIREAGSEASYLSLKSDLIRGNFPGGIENLIDEALATDADAGDKGTLNLDHMAGSRALASWRGQNPRVRFVAGKGNGKHGQVLVIYPDGVALIQKGNDQ